MRLFLGRVILLGILCSTALGFDADAGLVDTIGSSSGAVAYASSTTSPNEPAYVVGIADTTTYWESGRCFPIGYVSRSDINPLLRSCPQFCASSQGNNLGQFATATDGVLNIGTSVTPVSGFAFFQVTLSSATTLYSLAYEISSKAGSYIAFEYKSATGSSTPWNLISNTTTPQIGTISRFVLANTPSVQVVRISSDGAFNVDEIASQTSACFETVTIDYASPKALHWIELNSYAASAGVASTVLQSSLDGVTFQDIQSLNSSNNQILSYVFETALSVRLLRIRHNLLDQVSTTVRVYALDAYINSPFGDPPTAVISPRTISELLGVNGVYGWGLGTTSNTHTSSQGPQLYGALSSFFRDRHFMNYDVTDPDNNPDYIQMAQGGGTQARRDINWDAEYSAWLAVKPKLIASIVFNAQMFPPGVWTNPASAAFNYGIQFGGHFGPTGTEAVSAVEIGSEPWDYTADFYKTILDNMAKGIDTGSSTGMKIYPCALQAYRRETVNANSGNYIGARVSETVLPRLDGLIVHSYSAVRLSDGTTKTVWPEHPQSDMNQVNNMIVWRNTNLANKPIRVTEFGFASAQVVEQPCAYSECLSDNQAGLYAIRTALIMNRKGIDAIAYYNFANDVNPQSFLGKTGLTGSANSNFVQKRQYVALKGLLSQLGDRRFFSIIKEDSQAYVYLFSSKTSSAPSHVVAWLPVDGDDSTIRIVSGLSIPGTPQTSFLLTSLGAVQAVNPTQTNGLWSMTLTTTPIVTTIGGCSCSGITCGRLNSCGLPCTDCKECRCPSGQCVDGSCPELCNCVDIPCGTVSSCGAVCDSCKNGCKCPAGQSCDGKGNCVDCTCAGLSCGVTNACGDYCEDCHICGCSFGQICNNSTYKCDFLECDGECLDDVCQPECGENSDNCPRDCCPQIVCGDGTCDTNCGEDTFSCSVDCCPNSACGNGICERLCFETEASCPEDCSVIPDKAFLVEIFFNQQKKRAVEEIGTVQDIPQLIANYCTNYVHDNFNSSSITLIAGSSKGVRFFSCARCTPVFVAAVNRGDPIFYNTILENAAAIIILDGLDCDTGLQFIENSGKNQIPPVNNNGNSPSSDGAPQVSFSLPFFLLPSNGTSTTIRITSVPPPPDVSASNYPFLLLIIVFLAIPLAIL